MYNYEKLKNILIKINYIRTVPAYLSFLTCSDRKRIEQDIERWRCILHEIIDSKSTFSSLNWLLSRKKEFRNLILYRFKKESSSFALLHYAFTRIFWKPLDSLHLCTPDIGGGLYIQHGFATIVTAKKIGENCWINQQVTIGYKESHCPIIEDNVTICCGAKVLGNITMHSNSTAGAGAVVIKDVPENAIVGGVPAKIIKYKNK